MLGIWTLWGRRAPRHVSKVIPTFGSAVCKKGLSLGYLEPQAMVKTRLTQSPLPIPQPEAWQIPDADLFHALLNVKATSQHAGILLERCLGTCTAAAAHDLY